MPKITVAAAPQLATAITRAGFELLTDTTDPKEVAAAVRTCEMGPKALFVITPADTDLLRTWIESLASQGRRVLVLGDDTPPIKGTRRIALPATINDIMSLFSAPAAPAPYGDAVLNADLTVTDPWVAASAVEADADPWGNTGDDWDKPSAPPAIHVPSRHVEVDEFETVGPPQHHQPTPVAAPAPQVVAQVRPAPMPAPVVVAPQIAPQVRPAPAPVPAQVAQQPAPRPQPMPQPSIRPQPSRVEVAPRPVAPTTWVHDVAVGKYGDDGDDLAALIGESKVATTRSRNTGLAPVIICFAAKGGVGKSSFAPMLAQRAAEIGGLEKVICIDGSRGQGDLRKLLRVNGTKPTIYDAALQDYPQGAIVTPKKLAEGRDARLAVLKFGLVMAPRDQQSDPSVVTAQFYSHTVQAAREVADLVVIDTQILEDTDTSGLWDGVWVPLLLSMGGYGVGLNDSSAYGMTNLTSRLANFRMRGVGPERLMFALNRMPAETSLDMGGIAKMLGQFGTFVGILHAVPEVSRAFETGHLPIDYPPAALILDTILSRVTGFDAFDPERPGGPAELARPKSGGFFKMFRKAS